MQIYKILCGGMPMLFQFSMVVTILFFVAFSVCVAIHEFSHAFALYCFGDRSETIRSRLTLRPSAHMTLWGTLLFFFTGLLVGKPVMFEEDNIHEGYNGDFVLIITKLAGPISNLMAAIVGLLVINYLKHYPGNMDDGYSAIIDLLRCFSYVNVYLFCFNILPIPFLDGGIFIQLMANKVNYLGVLTLIVGTGLLLVILINSYGKLGIAWIDFLIIGYPDRVFKLLQSIIG